jgi:UDP-N-acetylglucosamine transferase subunit ALG13
MPGVRCLTQYRSWSRPGWSYDGTILDGWERTERDTGEPIRHVTVSAGSIRPYRFDRLIDAVLQRVSEEQDVTWQLGATEREGLRGDVHESLPWSELGDKIRSSDVYVCHAGVGSVLQALENGTIPILAVRSAVEHEHVDDHQGQLAREIVSRGLAIELDLSRPTGREFAEACRYGVRKRDDGDGTAVVRAEGMAAAAVPTAGAAVRVEAAAGAGSLGGGAVGAGTHGGGAVGDDPVIRLSGTGPEPTGDAPVTVPVHQRRRAGVGQS